MNNDMANSVFEFLGAVFQIKNTMQIYKDKEVKGVYWPAWIFFTAWGYFNIYYYPSLDQWWSFSAGILIAIANTVWVSMAYYYAVLKPLRLRGVIQK